MYIKMSQLIWFLIVTFSGLYSFEVEALQMGLPAMELHTKEFCSNGIYLDTDSAGRILEIDYAKCSAQVIGKLDFGERGVSSFLSLDTNRAYTEFYAFLQEGNLKKMQLYVATRANMRLRPTEIVVEIASDLSLIPMNGKALLWCGDSSAKCVRTIIDATSGKSIGGFDFNIHPAQRNWTSEDDNTLYCVSQNNDLGPFLRIVHINPQLSNRIVRLSDILSPGYYGTQVNISSASPQQFLISTGEHLKPSDFPLKQPPYVQRHLIQLPTLTPIAISTNERSPFIGEWYFLGKDRMVFHGLQDDEKSGYIPSGKYIVYIAKEGHIVTEDTIHQYNPATEILLKDGTGSVKPYAKYKFDYVSASELARERYESRYSSEDDASILARLTEQVKKDSTRKHLSIMDEGK